MKSIKLISILCVFVMFSCNKESDVVSPVTENEESATVNSSKGTEVTVGIYFTWTEWGRKSRGGKGALPIEVAYSSNL
ncbi:MAG: hypothetical protein LBV41_10755 [Cytophagaceae bacterium]|jgi:hypothetical protein|nr:hypothetical protein [Cytophagaceae bacterium]